MASIKHMAAIMGEITAASDEQSIGIGHVNQAINQMDQMTQQNSALVEQAAAAAESMRSQASTLTHAVSVFHLHPDDAVTSEAALALTLTNRVHSAVAKKRPLRVTSLKKHLVRPLRLSRSDGVSLPQLIKEITGRSFNTRHS